MKTVAIQITDKIDKQYCTLIGELKSHRIGAADLHQYLIETAVEMDREKLVSEIIIKVSEREKTEINHVKKFINDVVKCNDKTYKPVSGCDYSDDPAIRKQAMFFDYFNWSTVKTGIPPIGKVKFYKIISSVIGMPEIRSGGDWCYELKR